MRIEELIIEGFKSYPVRTQITGWDASFNAITGLNGSGKSNILDAISFVLGLTNMSTMRAQNQVDLIYKRGQAGVTKASVTIVFDNSDTEKSHPGYKDWKQITVTRQFGLPNVSKYLINGHKQTQHDVQAFFQSVQLNINNPNFVIMQGRITKVLNMRPQEILGMVEEAAGTRMFEDRKDKARKTMAKKDKRVQEIAAILAEEITPKLNKLREEKRTFMEYQKAENELQKIERVLKAWEYQVLRRRVQSSTSEIAAKREELKSAKENHTKFTKEMEMMEKEVIRVNRKREEEMKRGGKISQLEEQVGQLDKELVKVRTQVDISHGNIRDEEGRIVSSEEEVQNLEAALRDKKQEVDGLEADYNTVKAENDTLQNKLNSNEELLQTLLTGLSSKRNDANGGGGGYMGQIADAQARRAQGAAEEEQSRMRLSMSESELVSLEAQWKTVEKVAGDGKKRVETKKAAVADAKRKVEACEWNEKMENDGETRINELKGQLRVLADQRDRVRHNLGGLDFDYNNPRVGFDHRKVKGRLGALVELAPKDYDKATALEITAGGRLYHVIVDDENVGKDLLAPGVLKKRTNFIPLTQIEGFKVAPNRLDAAEKIAGDRARLALHLISYDSKLEKAMSYAFGGTFVCDDAVSAKKVTFDKRVGIRSVTLQGDVYDPSGTLSGGSAPSSSGILIKVQEMLEIEKKYSEAKGRLDEAERNWNGDQSKRKRDEWKRLTRDLEIKEHELKLAEEQVGESNAARLGAQVEELRKTIATLSTDVQRAKEKQKEAETEAKKLQKDMEEFKNNKDGKIEELKASISRQKAAVQKHTVIVKTKHKEHQTGFLEMQQIENDITAAKETVEEVQSNVAKLRRELQKLQAQLETRQVEYNAAARKLEEEKATLTRFDKELKDLEKNIKEKKKSITQADEEIAELDENIKALGVAKESASKKADQLEKTIEWIAEEKHMFGQPNSSYDFDSMDTEEMRLKAEDLEKSQRAKKKKINPKAVNMMDDVEKRETTLKKNMNTVLKDKQKIEETIEELDRYKRDALQKTWEKVNGDFGGIFGELLPGNFAKLQPPEGQDLMDGLEVKVQLGSVWKQSLTELSGGQRSLIALSLIMALLQFKPAPMYILDEIDAALDLSHTQHIGHLFRTRFKGSQFIVVSLKEGLFTNANVLFRTKFRDGTSVVERTTHRSGSALYEQERGEEEDVQVQGRLGAGRRARR